MSKQHFTFLDTTEFYIDPKTFGLLFCAKNNRKLNIDKLKQDKN